MAFLKETTLWREQHNSYQADCTSMLGDTDFYGRH